MARRGGHLGNIFQEHGCGDPNPAAHIFRLRSDLQGGGGVLEGPVQSPENTARKKGRGEEVKIDPTNSTTKEVG
jgi:hypothetical protein